MTKEQREPAPKDRNSRTFQHLNLISFHSLFIQDTLDSASSCIVWHVPGQNRLFLWNSKQIFVCMFAGFQHKSDS